MHPFIWVLTILQKNSDKSWFKASAMGVNKLNSLMKKMAERAGLDNSHLTNHSARKRMIQTLNDKDIPPSHIMQLSGHKNVQSINTPLQSCLTRTTEKYVKNIEWLVFNGSN